MITQNKTLLLIQVILIFTLGERKSVHGGNYSEARLGMLQQVAVRFTLVLISSWERGKEE